MYLYVINISNYVLDDIWMRLVRYHWLCNSWDLIGLRRLSIPINFVKLGYYNLIRQTPTYICILQFQRISGTKSAIIIGTSKLEVLN